MIARIMKGHQSCILKRLNSSKNLVDTCRGSLSKPPFPVVTTAFTGLTLETIEKDNR
jgi:hypothetical protein